MVSSNGTAPAKDYRIEVPDSEYIRDGLNFAIQYWRGRNSFITDVRKMLAGENAIQAPISSQYKIRLMHTYLLASIVNEKAARFLHQPEIQIIPDDETPEARARSTELEQGISRAFYEMERRGDPDSWSKLVVDSILIDEGVERIERATAAFWHELGSFKEQILRDNYKKEQGIHMRSVYVPLENFLPVYEGPTQVESYEYEMRSLRSVMTNPTFDKSQLRNFDMGTDKGLSQLITIVHHVNQQYHSYWALTPSQSAYNWPSIATTLEVPTYGGDPVLLYSYKHGLNRTIYNCVAGRFGGWKTSTNRIEGVGKGILELNQRADEIASQVLTNIGAKYWPSHKWTIDPDRRGYAVGGTAPKAPNVKEGEPIVLFIGEDLKPQFEPKEDPTVPWLFDQIKEQLGKLGGSPVLFGMRQPGVDTGYHQALQITQGEHLDEKIEQHLVQGAINRATLFFQHVRAGKEEVFAHFAQEDSKGHKQGKYVSIKPDELFPCTLR